MAIDSAAKRRSVSNIGLQVAPSVTPDSDQDQLWRQSSAWSYYGITADAVTALDLEPPYTASWVDPARTASWTDPSRTATWVDPNRTAEWED